ncbi:MAG: 4-(cytidine 5'-diphospho)-2-C-methyl-D-erythritol kinase [Clostridia bacterium]|nr:4-(cytidine 5'-diphospho)-2-C-methyl-D-erythritol kinase [Clostridia bacterium]
MESVRIKSYAKLNLTLSITGVADGYHTIDSLVTSVDLYDLIVLKKRTDKQVTITMHGCGSEGIPYESNNAVKAAQYFIEAYDTYGADITVYKNIPMGAGLGGSSADSAGVLNGLEKLYGTRDLAGKKLLADRTGSDTRYMLSGGYARLTGRGNEVTPIESDLKLNYLLLAPETEVSSAQCYKTYDEMGGGDGDTQKALSALLNGDREALAKNLCNDLAPAAKQLTKEVVVAFDELASFAPLAVNMTGSGSGVYALFDSPELRAYAKSRYRGKFRTIELKTYIPK